MSGVKSPPQLSSPQDKGGEEKHNLQNITRKKRRVSNTHKHLGTRLNSDVTSATTPIAIEGVKDRDEKVNLACCSVKIKGGNGGK